MAASEPLGDGTRRRIVANIKFRALYLETHDGPVSPRASGLGILEDGTPVLVVWKQVQKAGDKKLTNTLHIANVAIQDDRPESPSMFDAV
jgi:hypothetical protein